MVLEAEGHFRCSQTVLLVQTAALDLPLRYPKDKAYSESISKVKLLISWCRQYNRDKGFQTRGKYINIREKKENWEMLEHGWILSQITPVVLRSVHFHFSKLSPYSQDHHHLLKDASLFSK